MIQAVNLILLMVEIVTLIQVKGQGDGWNGKGLRSDRKRLELRSEKVEGKGPIVNRQSKGSLRRLISRRSFLVGHPHPSQGLSGIISSLSWHEHLAHGLRLETHDGQKKDFMSWKLMPPSIATFLLSFRLKFYFFHFSQDLAGRPARTLTSCSIRRHQYSIRDNFFKFFK